MECLNSNQSLSLSKLLRTIIFLLLAAFVLTPRFWEPTVESYTHWALARILRETGGFPSYYRGPGYIIYLQLYQFFQYPLSIQIEYCVTHLFTYIALFLMLQRLLPNVFALLFICAWIPTLAQVEPGTNVAIIGFLALYLKDNICPSSGHRKYFPNSLLAATLCHSAAIFFLVGHIIGVIIERLIKKQPFLNFSFIIGKKQIFSFIFKFLVAIILALTILFPSRRWDSNYEIMDTKYMPTPQKNPVSSYYFRHASWLYATKDIPESLWYKQDYYFNHKKTFGDTTNFFKAVFNNPEAFKILFSKNLKNLIRLPREFITGNFFNNSTETAICLFLFPFGLFGLFRRLKNNGCIAAIFSIVLGSTALILALMLTTFHERFIAIFLPIYLLIDVYIGAELWSMLRRKRVNSPNASIIFVMVVSALVLFSANYPYGKKEQLKAVLNNRAFLSQGVTQFSMTNFYRQLLKTVNQNSKILALEDYWLKAFSKVNLDNIYNVFSLPPFPDSSGETEKFLNNLDEIWVNSYWPIKGYNLFGMLTYIRYELHVELFLRKKLSEGWSVEEISKYGKIYRRPLK